MSYMLKLLAELNKYDLLKVLILILLSGAFALVMANQIVPTANDLGKLTAALSILYANLLVTDFGFGLVKKFAGILSKRPSLKKLFSLTDLMPTALRKKVKAMVSDYDEQIRMLYKKKRYKAARWNQWMAWGFAFWYVFRSPLDAVMAWAIGQIRSH